MKAPILKSAAPKRQIAFKLNSLTACFIAVFIIFCTWPNSAAAAPAKVLILPLEIYAEKDLAFMQKGIEAMLATRLTREDKILPISKADVNQALQGLTGPINQAAAVSLGTRLQADYVIFGSITVFGDNISTDARFFDVFQKKPLITFNQSGQSTGDVIAHINLFTQRIIEQVFGLKIDAAPAPKAQGNQAELSKHPEKLLYENSGQDGDWTDAPRASRYIRGAMWRSRKFKIFIRGLAVGDVDGDGRQETVFINENKVFVFRYINGKFMNVAEMTQPSHNTFISVDVADINNNGRAEIFVTSFSGTDTLRSFVLEWDGKQLIKIADKEPWYFRVIQAPDLKGQILVGQKRSIKKIFYGSIYEFEWRNNKYVPANAYILPKSANVYGFAYGDATNNGRMVTVAYTRDERLRLFDNGEEEWTSNKRYGGHSIYLTKNSSIESTRTKIAGDPVPLERVYLPQRVIIADMNKDGKNEVVVVQNIDSAGRVFGRLRLFVSGQIKSLFWDNVGLYEQWETHDISGFISDFAVTDFNNDGTDDLVFAVVTQTGSGLSTAKSFIVAMAVKK